jgi:putative membrane protein insertion efficiency factor
MTYVARALVAPIRLYQRLISPFLGPRCRFYPSCSEYAAGSILRHGPIKGLYLGVRRILRCHPWNPGGFDEVPEVFTWRHVAVGHGPKTEAA